MATPVIEEGATIAPEPVRLIRECCVHLAVEAENAVCENRTLRRALESIARGQVKDPSAKAREALAELNGLRPDAERVVRWATRDWLGKR